MHFLSKKKRVGDVRIVEKHAIWRPLATMRQRFLQQELTLAVWPFGPAAETGNGTSRTLTACWKSTDMPMLSSTWSVGMFSFLHSSSRSDNNI